MVPEHEPCCLDGGLEWSTFTYVDEARCGEYEYSRTTQVMFLHVTHVPRFADIDQKTLIILTRQSSDVDGYVLNESRCTDPSGPSSLPRHHKRHNMYCMVVGGHALMPRFSMMEVEACVKLVSYLQNTQPCLSRRHHWSPSCDVRRPIVDHNLLRTGHLKH